MAKRFTDSDKWKDAWFMDLPSKYKLFWIYLLDECNHAGIWKVNFRVASFYVGEHLEHSEVKRILSTRLTILNDEYWFINKFIKYQYKCDIQELNPKNKAHLSTIKLLNEYETFKPLTSPLLGVKDKDKDKDSINTIEKIQEINENDLIETTEVLKQIDVVYDKFLKEVKNHNYDSKIEVLYMTLKIRKGSLMNLLKEFRGVLIKKDRVHKTHRELFENFDNWLNVQDRVGKLDSYKIKSNKSLSI